MSGSHSIADRMSLSIITATALLFLVSMIWVFEYASDKVWEEAQARSYSSLENVQNGVEDITNHIETSANSLVWIINEHKSDSVFLFHLCEQFIRQNESVVSAQIAFEPFLFPSKGEYCCINACRDKDGNILEAGFGAESYDYFTMDWYLLPKLLNHSSWTEPYIEDNTGHLLTSYSIPIKDEFGVVTAVFCLDVSLNTLQEKMSKILTLNSSFVFILGCNGSFITHSDESLILSETIFSRAIETDNDDLYQLGLDMIAGKTGIAEHIGDNKKKLLVVYGPLSNGWSCGIACLYDVMFKSSLTFRNIFFIILAFILLTLFFISRKIIKKITEPISEFTFSAMSIAQGNFHATIPEVHTKDELKHLQESLHYLKSSINSYIGELKTTTASNERFESELNIANGIQMAMLSTDFPSRAEFDLYAKLSPAKEVGGDLYDFFIEGNRLYFAVGDVSGKGVPAALYMAITRSAFRFIAKLGFTMDEIVGHINNVFAEGNESNMFVTMFVGCIDLVTYEMKYCNAGHNPIVICESNGMAHYLYAKPNIAAGLFEGFKYQAESIFLQSGSRVVVYTDGVTEAERRDKEQYGEERLLEFSKKRDDNSHDFTENLVNSVKDFTAGNEQNDDITILTIKMK